MSMDQDFQLETEFAEMLDAVNSMCRKLQIEYNVTEVIQDSEDLSGADS